MLVFCTVFARGAAESAPPASTLADPVPVPAELVLASGKRVGADETGAGASKVALTVTQKIDARLQQEAAAFSKEWLGTEITAARMIKETDAYCAEYLKRLTQSSAQSTAPVREEALRRKSYVHNEWKQKRTVLLSHLSATGPSLTLHRFDGGKDGTTGYVIMKGDQAYRSLTLRMNRADPAIGNAVLPIPQTD